MLIEMNLKAKNCPTGSKIQANHKKYIAKEPKHVAFTFSYCDISPSYEDLFSSRILTHQILDLMRLRVNSQLPNITIQSETGQKNQKCGKVHKAIRTHHIECNLHECVNDFQLGAVAFQIRKTTRLICRRLP